jgi:UDP-N-acetylmuramyl pentapeptide phosphotransferase/UDP-N-acetylglucosamine-1-phosphate transferase
MLQALVAFVVSVVVNLLVLRVAKKHPHALDHDFSGPQKFHHKAVPRVGGVGILLGMAAGLLALGLGPLPGARAVEIRDIGWMLLACSIPAFGAGIIEDLTKRVSPGKRLLATALSGLLAAWLVGAVIRHTDTPGLDMLVATTVGAYAFTLLVVAGTANAVNLIDGFNGLASMCVVIMMSAVAYVAYQVDDPLVMNLALLGIGATLGFFIWNFPAGLIFLGDGGAYFLGFWFAELSILLLVRNPGEVSPLFPLLVCIYPVFETVFSAYRRRVLRGQSAGSPDGMHLHSLIYRRVMRWALEEEDVRALTHRNSMTSPFLWLLCMLSVIPAVVFWDETVALALFLMLFVISYLALYWNIVRFRSPGWMRNGRR